jgi:hypothetical protein
MNTTTNNKDTLEAMVNNTSLRHVLELLADVCNEKADSMRSSLHAPSEQRTQGTTWERCGNRIAELSTNYQIGLIS